MKFVLGDCVIKKSINDKIQVNLVYTYSDEKFEAIMTEKSRYLELREKYRGNNHDGESKWTISIPADVEIDFESATGDLYIENVDIEIDGNTGTEKAQLKR